MSDLLAELQHVTVEHTHGRGRPAVTALRSVDLRLHRGERVAFVGRSGAGKTTLAHVLNGLIRPTAGSVEVLGERVGDLDAAGLRALRRRVHVVFQDPYGALHPGMTVGEAVAEPLVIEQTPREERDARVTEALRRVGLERSQEVRDRYPSSLSGGQRQRVCIARALVSRPELVIADEPASMLDASLRTTVIDLLLDLHEVDGCALVFITHDLALARHIADRVIVVADGAIVEDGPTHELMADPRHRETRRLLAAARSLHGPRRSDEPLRDDDERPER